MTQIRILVLSAGLGVALTALGPGATNGAPATGIVPPASRVKSD